MQRVLVLDMNKQALMPCHPARARQLLKMGKAAVFRRFPFTIILKEVVGEANQDISLKIDCGARTTGLTLVGNFQQGQTCIWAAELNHRSFFIRDALLKRRNSRRFRRYRKLRYRAIRFKNRKRPDGWLAPSLLSRLQNIITWTKRLLKLVPINKLAMELVRFDTQALQNPEIKGVEYQQGELMGYEVRQYLLEKWGRHCAYCQVTNVPLQIEHIVPKSRGGSNRVSNLTLACNKCNRQKDNQTAEEFGYPEIQAKAKKSLAAAAAMNSVRWALFRFLQSFGLDFEVGTGGHTKFNRTRQEYPKSHWIDAACIGKSGESIVLDPLHKPLIISAVGHGSRQICRTDKFGFPVRHRLRQKRHFGFQTGDIVKVIVPKGKYTGTYLGRVACRATGKFDISTRSTKIAGINHKHCWLVHHADGYAY
jgi:5-methylcytosine-specific restriction endonuclease McrA